MRHLPLSGLFLILLAALFLLWQHRFERSLEFSTCNLADLQEFGSLPPGAEWSGPASGPTLKLRADPASPGIAVRFDLPVTKPVDFLHLRFQLAAVELIPGQRKWEDGRAIIEWHPAGGGSEWENDSFLSLRDTGVTGVTEIVMRPDERPAVPALRVENLGISGVFEIRSFKASVLRESTVWKVGRWILVAAWIAWAMAWIRSIGDQGRIRGLLAACVWLLMGLYFVVPGPWKSIRSLGAPFALGEEVMGQRDPAQTSSPDDVGNGMVSHWSPVALKAVGKIPDKGDFTLRLKLQAEKARSILHVILLFAPTLVSACLVGRKATVSLAIIVALCIEAAQFSFGFGFDRVDVFDLVWDATGIVIALAAHRYLKRKFPNWVIA